MVVLFALCPLLMEAQAGSTNYQLGRKYYLAKDYENAKFYFEQAIKNENTDGLCGLAGMYLNGFGVTKDETKAFELYLEAALKDNIFGMEKAATMYRDGIGTERSDRESFRWFARLAERGNVKGQVGVGNGFLYGRGTAKNERTAVYYFALASLQGDDVAICNLGYCYENGLGGLPRKAYAQAMSLYNDACVKEYELACKNEQKFEKWLQGEGVELGTLPNATTCIQEALRLAQE